MKTNDDRLAELEKWVRKKIACGSWQASYEEFLAKIQEVKMIGTKITKKEKGD